MIQYCHEATMNATGGFQIFSVFSWIIPIRDPIHQ